MSLQVGKMALGLADGGFSGSFMASRAAAISGSTYELIRVL